MTTTPITSDDDTALDPAAALALIGRQQEVMGKQTARDIPWILLAWGVAWSVGFGMLWLIDGAKPGFSIPLPVAAITFAVLTIGAIVASAVIGARAGRGIRTSPAAAFTGTVYGITGSVGFFALFAFGTALVYNGMPADLQNIYYPVGSALLVGIMYLMAAAIWRTKSLIILGGWIILVALVAPFLGYPNHYLVFAIAGGGGFLISAATLAWAMRVPRGVDA